MSHNGDYWRPRYFGPTNTDTTALHLGGAVSVHYFDIIAEFVSYKSDRFDIESLIGGCHNPEFHEFPDHHIERDAHKLCKFRRTRKISYPYVLRGLIDIGFHLKLALMFLFPVLPLSFLL